MGSVFLWNNQVVVGAYSILAVSLPVLPSQFAVHHQGGCYRARPDSTDVAIKLLQLSLGIFRSIHSNGF